MPRGPAGRNDSRRVLIAGMSRVADEPTVPRDWMPPLRSGSASRVCLLRQVAHDAGALVAGLGATLAGRRGPTSSSSTPRARGASSGATHLAKRGVLDD